MRCRRLWLPLVLVALATFLAHAADVGVQPGKLTLVDVPSAPKKSKATFGAKGGAISKGEGVDAGVIGAIVDVNVCGTRGRFTIPAAAYDGTSGWSVKKTTQAKFVNKAAPSGATQVKTASIKRGASLAVAAKGSGDERVARGQVGGVRRPAGDLLDAVDERRRLADAALAQRLRGNGCDAGIHGQASTRSPAHAQRTDSTIFT